MDFDENKVLDYIKKSLGDIRCIGAILHLKEVLVGIDRNGDEYNRITTKDGTEIKTIEDLIGALKVDEMVMTRVKVGTERFYNSLSGARVTFKDILINITSGKTGDKTLCFDFGAGTKNLVFVVSYFADLDNELPLKVNYIDMVDHIEEIEDDEDK